MRQGKVFYKDIFAGIVSETDDGEYTFAYQPSYIEEYPTQFLTFSMPVKDNIYRDRRLFPFFEGLIPEGWLLDIASDNWKINKNDRMGLLLACCKNCIGAVSVEPLDLSTDE
ncbi:HipA N-terminal domain-containing protein [Epilithonimonas ginsengisoli]|uniref:HipA N-terminal domain-containing protein n=1 Tax=Epilithonimonas ginsengisoli TaxID=1245592 RepID=A0ABU4JGU6_9FLAO|nr:MULTISPECIES: HipA N-terminal domain-containing protein [Chryseobacterium group]MBV6878763.1 HipA N-terminal domain-containing protein [Epilithonimonas sp. FP105]MDW8548906.1 HipA N-terminal domain-containing protein [Epilithonimonas ginsengisoli]OAH75594.1 phosphatidylinositol kinase [Chryseobacterium sp. FP211-J200]